MEMQAASYSFLKLGFYIFSKVATVSIFYSFNPIYVQFQEQRLQLQMKKQVILLALFLFLISPTESSKKLRRGSHHHGSAKKDGGGGYGYSFFDKSRNEEDSYHKKSKKDDDTKTKRAQKYFRGNNVYAAKRVDQIAQRLGKNVGSLLHTLFESKIIEPKVVPGRRVKASCGPRSTTGVLMEHWVLFTLISVAAVLVILGIDCMTNKRMASKYASTADSEIQVNPEKRHNEGFKILAFIKNGGYEGLRQRKKEMKELEGQ